MNYTTLEQSRKLVECGLPQETCDMCYIENPVGEYRITAYPMVECAVLRDARGSNADLYPSWSVGILMDMLPDEIEYQGTYCYLSFSKTHISYEGCDSYDSFYKIQLFYESDKPFIELLIDTVCWLLKNKHQINKV